MNIFRKLAFMLLAISTVVLTVSCGNSRENGSFVCKNASFNFPSCPTVRSCCSESFCYYDVDGLTFDCQGTDCSRASDRVVDYCTGTDQDTATADVVDNDFGEPSGSDTGSTASCDPCQYCAQVISFTSNSQGFIAANKVICRVAGCDGDGILNCYVNIPMRFVAGASDCTEFEDTCPGDKSIECVGESDTCSVYRGSSTWDCNETQYCDHYTGNWECPDGYTKGDKCRD